MLSSACLLREYEISSAVIREYMELPQLYLAVHTATLCIDAKEYPRAPRNERTMYENSD